VQLTAAGEALAGASVGTVFTPTGRRTPTRLLWLSHASTPQGKLFLDPGAVAAVKSATQKLGGEVMPADQAIKLWQSLRDQEDEFFTVQTADPELCLWRLSVPSLAAHVEEIVDPQIIEWGGALRWVKTRLPAERIRALARRCGGHATLFRAPLPKTRTQVGTFTELTPAMMKIHQRLKQELDAKNIFNPGRMFAGL